jgi:hypothetical protein
MATKKAYDLCVAVGKYEKDGKEKNRYQTVGVVLEKDDGGKFIILEPWFNPAGVAHEAGKGVMLSMFEPKANGAPTGAPAGNDDIPF